MHKGIFVAIEGIDGSGKTTQVKNVYELLKKNGYSVLYTQEPTRDKLGLILREYLKNKNTDPHVDALLFAADRIEHYNKTIQPNIKDNKIVITDRYKISSFVYQNAQGVDLDWIREINKMAPDPDIVIYLDIPVDIALKRLNSADRSVIEKFETRNYLTKIYENYMKFKEKFIFINAEGSIDSITQNIYTVITDYINKM